MFWKWKHRAWPFYLGYGLMRPLDFFPVVVTLDVQVQTHQCKCESNRFVGSRSVLGCESIYHVLMDEIRTRVRQRVIGKLVILLLRIC